MAPKPVAILAVLAGLASIFAAHWPFISISLHTGQVSTTALTLLFWIIDGVVVYWVVTLGGLSLLVIGMVLLFSGRRAWPRLTKVAIAGSVLALLGTAWLATGWEGGCERVPAPGGQAESCWWFTHGP